jgi:hypothetical protein
VKLFEITVGGRRFAVGRAVAATASDDDTEYYQTYFVDGRDVPVEHYLRTIAMAVKEQRDRRWLHQPVSVSHPAAHQQLG